MLLILLRTVISFYNTCIGKIIPALRSWLYVNRKKKRFLNYIIRPYPHRERERALSLALPLELSFTKWVWDSFSSGISSINSRDIAWCEWCSRSVWIDHYKGTDLQQHKSGRLSLECFKSQTMADSYWYTQVYCVISMYNMMFFIRSQLLQTPVTFCDEKTFREKSLNPVNIHRATARTG